MEQSIRVGLPGNREAFVSWKGHTSRLNESDEAFVRKSVVPFVESMLAERVRKHACEYCKRADDRAAHAREAELDKMSGKTLGSF
jgi:hypothetical protein